MTKNAEIRFKRWNERKRERDDREEEKQISNAETMNCEKWASRALNGRNKNNAHAIVIFIFMIL